MDSYIERYIDSNIIREYAEKRDQYSLDVSDLPQNEISNLTDLLLNKDPVIKDIILDRIQDLINSRITLVEAKDNFDSGLYPIHDCQTGEVIWKSHN